MPRIRVSKLSSRSIKFDGLDVALDTRLTPSELLTAVQRQRPISLFYHRNRDGSVMVAYGREPDRWPEDERFQPDPEDGPRGITRN